MKKHVSFVFAMVVPLLLSILPSALAGAVDCDGGVSLQFVGFELFGVARFEIENTLPAAVQLVGFKVNWVQHMPPGVNTLERVTIDAPFGQPGAVLLWDSGNPVEDANPPTISSQEGVWAGDYTLASGATSPFLVDFSGTAGLLSGLGFSEADFAGTSLTVKTSLCDLEVRFGGAAVPSDGRLNFGLGDWQAVIYGEDGAGNPAIHIYGVNGDSEGYIVLALTAAQLEALPKNPSENLLIAAVNDRAVAVYLLTTGEYQINIGPDSAGNVEVLVFTGLPASNLYHYSFNINAILYPAN